MNYLRFIQRVASRNAGTIRGLSGIIDELARESLGLEVPYRDLGEGDRARVDGEMVRIRGRVEADVNKMSSKPEVRSAIYNWLLSSANGSKDILFVTDEGVRIVGLDGRYKTPEEFDDIYEVFLDVANAGKMEKNILKYKSYREWSDAVLRFKEHENGKAREKHFERLKKVFAVSGVDVYLLYDYDSAKRVLSASNFGRWCVKDRDAFERYGPRYYLGVKGTNPYCLISDGENNPQIKDFQNKAFDNVNEGDPICLIIKKLVYWGNLDLVRMIESSSDFMPIASACSSYFIKHLINLGLIDYLGGFMEIINLKREDFLEVMNYALEDGDEDLAENALSQLSSAIEIPNDLIKRAWLKDKGIFLKIMEDGRHGIRDEWEKELRQFT